MTVNLCDTDPGFRSVSFAIPFPGNWCHLMPVYQAWGEVLSAPVGQLRHRAITRNRIVLGAFARHIMDEDAESRKLMLPENDPFLAALDTCTDAENRRILAPWIARWSKLEESEIDAPESA